MVSRAVAHLDLLWKWSAHLIESGGCLYAIKGGDHQHELADLSVQDIQIEIMTPDKEWINASNYLNHKYIIKMEK